MKNVAHAICRHVQNVVFLALPSGSPDANGKLKMLGDGPGILKVLDQMLRL